MSNINNNSSAWSRISDAIWSKNPKEANESKGEQIAERAAEGALKGGLLGAITPLGPAGIIAGAAAGIAKGVSDNANEIQTKDKTTIKTDKGEQGSAPPIVGKKSDEMIKAWVAARDDSAAIESFKNIESAAKLPSTVQEHLNGTDFNADQKKAVIQFMLDVKNAGKVENSENEALVNRGYIDVMLDGMKDPGINNEQLELIANGDFNIDAYKAMVKNGDSSA